MRLQSVTVENFRSITVARQIPISELTTLVGPNNEGKSNILRALVIAMNYLSVRSTYRQFAQYRLSSNIRRRRQNSYTYDWLTDYPLKLQSKSPDGGSKITLDLSLSREETEAFFHQFKCRLNGSLPIAISFFSNKEEVSIPKQGPGQKTLNAKANTIAEFVAKRIGVQYIPAVRNAESAQTIVNELVQSELAHIEKNDLYIQAMRDIAALQQPILDQLSASVTTTLRNFLPNIRQARIAISERDRSFALSAISTILIDDGAETLLEYKGDGVQSLAALALMRHVSETKHADMDMVIALEEPESHLHPTAIRGFRAVLMELSRNHQVVITTHNPIFTNRSDVKQNIIVNKNRAYAADSVKQVRDVLGVRLGDNLTTAEVVLIVEGEEDRIALASILASMDSVLESELKSGRLAIDVLGGASNLSHRIRLYSESVCRVHAFLDDDRAGRQAVEAARSEGLIDTDSLNLAVVGGKLEAELEDLYKSEIYSDILIHEIGLNLVRQGPDRDKKWSDRVKGLLHRAGKPRDDSTLLSVKIKVARAVAECGKEAIHENKIGPIESLKNSLLNKLHLQSSILEAQND